MALKRLLPLVLLLLAVPAAGQAPVLQDAELVQVVPLAWGTVGLSDDPHGDSSLATKCTRSPLASGAQGLFDVDPRVGVISFAEGADENACGLARFAMGVPAGARRVMVSFQAHMAVASLGGLPTVDGGVLQFWVQNATDEPGTEIGYEDQLPSDGSTGLVTITTELAADQRLAYFGWYFEDLHNLDDPLQVLATAGGRTMTARVFDIAVRFEGTPLPGLGFDQDAAGIESGEAVHTTVVYFDVPDLAGQIEARFSLSNAFGIDHAVAPDGRRLDDSELRSQESKGLLTFILGSDVIAAHGAGRYAVHFRSTQAIELTPVAYPVLALVVIAPVVAGTFGQRSVTRLYRRSHDTGQFRLFQGALIGGWMGYAAILVAVLATGLMAVMLSWPVAPGGVWPYLALAAVFVAFVTLAALARRQEVDAIQHDLTARERIQRDLERSNQELEQFAYVASHDLKEPLRMVASYTQLLKRRYGDRLDDDAKEYIDFASEGAGRMQQMIEDLLTYSRVGRERRPPEPVDLGATMDLVRKQLRKTIEDTGAEVTDKGLPTVHGDRMQLLHLLQNLVHNGLKFHGDGPPRVQVSAVHRGRQWTVRVQDNGIGIPPAHQDRIFQIFQRLHARDEYEGSGIGLALCKKIVEQHGGRIRVESVPGKGATFLFTLPDGAEGRDADPAA